MKRVPKPNPKRGGNLKKEAVITFRTTDATDQMIDTVSRYMRITKSAYVDRAIMLALQNDSVDDISAMEWAKQFLASTPLARAQKIYNSRPWLLSVEEIEELEQSQPQE